MATLCDIRINDDPCPHTAHVVLFAGMDGPFGGQDYSKGDRVLTCLKHGAEIYDARGAARRRGFAAAHIEGMPAWLYGKVHTLPGPHSPYRQVVPTPRERGYQQPYRGGLPVAERRRRSSVEFVTPALVLENDTITHIFDEYDRAAIDLIAE